MQRRTFLTLAAAGAVLPLKAWATVPKPYSWDAAPPMDDVARLVRWMQENRGEDARYLRARFERFQNVVRHVDLWETRNKRARTRLSHAEGCAKALKTTAPDRAYAECASASTWERLQIPPRAKE